MISSSTSVAIGVASEVLVEMLATELSMGVRTHPNVGPHIGRP